MLQKACHGFCEKRDEVKFKKLLQEMKEIFTLIIENSCGLDIFMDVSYAGAICFTKDLPKDSYEKKYIG